MRIVVIFFLVFFSALTVNAQSLDNEIAVLVAPLKLDDKSNYQLMYKRSLPENLKLRSGLRLLVNTDKTLRSDSVIVESGSFGYNLSLGIQKDLQIGDLEKMYLYAGSDLYWNSEFNRKTHESYYGYYWNFGTKPLLGVSYEPFSNIRLSFESRANFNINLQEYSAAGENYDRKYKFSVVDELALSVGYLF